MMAGRWLEAQGHNKREERIRWGFIKRRIERLKNTQTEERN